jgi:hypothetical protein
MIRVPSSMIDNALPDSVGELAGRVEERMSAVEQRLGEEIADRLSVAQARAASVALAAVSTLSVPAAAQSVGELGQAMCGSGVGQLVGFVFIGAGMYYLIKSVFKTMGALDKMESTSSGTAREGKEELSGAATTGAAAFLPAVAAGIFEVLGINTVSCLDLSSWSVIGTIVLVPF